MTTSATHDQTTLDLSERIVTVTGRIRRSLRRSDEVGLAEGPNLTLSQEAAMGHLLRSGAQSTADLARLEGVRPQSMGLTVGGLEELGLVEKSADPQDARRSLVDLTESGRSSHSLARGRRVGILAERLGSRAEPADLEVLARALDLLDVVVAD